MRSWMRAYSQLGKNALLFGRRVRFADAVAAGRLNLAGEPADVAFELHQLVVMIGERLFEALAAQLAPLGLGGVGSLLPDGRERCDFGLVRRFAGRDVGDHRRVARRAIGVATEREVFSDGLADHFQLGLGAGHRPNAVRRQREGWPSTCRRQVEMTDFGGQNRQPWRVAGYF